MANIDIKEVRDLFSRSSEEKRAARALREMLAGAPQEDARLQAYRGVTEAMSAREYLNPMKKLSAFQQGKSRLEAAVAADPDNPEIRFVRFMLQKNVPGYLNYQGNLQEDYQKLIDGIEDEGFVKELGDWLPMVVNVLLNSDYCNEQDASTLHAVLHND